MMNVTNITYTIKEPTGDDAVQFYSAVTSFTLTFDIAHQTYAIEKYSSSAMLDAATIDLRQSIKSDMFAEMGRKLAELYDEWATA